MIALALASAGGGWSCGRRGEAVSDRRPSSVADAIRRVHLGQTTPGDVQQLFGGADERAPDGALIYRFNVTRKRGEQVRAEVETVTFRFTNGTLAKVCRTRQ